LTLLSLKSIGFEASKTIDTDIRLDHDTLYFVERDLIAGAVIELRGLGRFVVGDGLGVFDGPAVLQVGGNAGRPERVVADGVRQSSGPGPPLDHVEGVPGVNRAVSQYLLPAAYAAEQGAFLLGGDACRCQIGIDVIGGVVMGGHFMPLAAFLMEPKPCLPAFGVVILHLHAEGGPDAGEAVDHHGDQGPVA
jgi:hypothetical protein